MSPRLNLLRQGHSVLSKATPSASINRLALPFRPRNITSSEKPLPTKADQKTSGPNQEQLPHVSEEAADTAQIMGETSPEIDAQGTPVQEVLARSDKAKENAPQVVKDELQGDGLGKHPNVSPSSGAKVPSGSRSYSTTARRRALTIIPGDGFNPEISKPTGHIFPLPQLPLPSHLHMRHRYEPIVEQMTNLFMRDGKKATAQRNMALVLHHLRLAPPPNPSSRHPLLPGTPPPRHLPLDPILYLATAIDSVAPLFRIRAQKGIAGGGASVSIPIPLPERQRRRIAMQWVLDAASKRKWRGSGKGGLAQRVAEEIVSVVEGRSGIWDKRGGVHRMGVAGRSNLGRIRK